MPIGVDGQSYETELHYQLGIPQLMPGDESKPVTGQDKQEPETDWSKAAPKKIYYIRHGETDANEGNCVRGWGPWSLNDNGRADAEKAAKSVSDAGVQLEHIVASPLPRAAETARIVSNKLGGIPVEYHPGLMTWNTGHLTGQKEADVGKQLEALQYQTPDERPPGSTESYNEFTNRFLGAIGDIVNRHSDKEVGVVSHNSPAEVLKNWDKKGQPPQADFLKPLMQWWFGLGHSQTQPKVAAPKYTDFPTDQQSDEYRDTNMQYGDPNAKFLTPGLSPYRTIGGLSFDTIDRMSNEDTQRGTLRIHSEGHPIDLNKADAYNKAWIASRRSALSQLGFDLSSLYEAPEREKGTLNVAGLTHNPKGTKMAGDMWYDPTYKDAVLHEAMHRGLEKLQSAGLLPADYDHELLVRRMTEKHFGPDSSVGDEGKRLQALARRTIPDSEVDRIEKMAADYIAKKHPGGPR